MLPTYERAIEIARDLIGDSAATNSEYLRGQVELIADLYGYRDDEPDMDCAKVRILRDLDHVPVPINAEIRDALEAIWAVLPEEPNRALGVFDLLADIDRANTNAS